MDIIIYWRFIYIYRDTYLKNYFGLNFPKTSKSIKAKIELIGSRDFSSGDMYLPSL